ncbi:MAG: hypothetical protein HC805_04660 [Alkalinema sp. RL_2_19]|nr:hypothetical protein [Alkalinema sp. RL_2_19]
MGEVIGCLLNQSRVTVNGNRLISSDLIVAGTVGLGQICLDADRVYWSESRPTEAGRNVIVAWQPNGSTAEINPAPLNARTRVHEYGGAAFHVANGTIYFVNFVDQRIYQVVATAAPTPLTAEGPWRYTNMLLDKAHDRLIAIREDHSNPDQEAVNTLVAIDFAGNQTVLASGHDFFASPSLNADGTKLTWLTWDHPQHALGWHRSFGWLTFKPMAP